MGHWQLRAEGSASAQTQPEFAPVAGDLLHLRSEARSTASASAPLGEPTIPYRVSWWLYVIGDMYDDFVVYQAKDSAGEPTDITLMLRETWEKLPQSPDDWHGMVWVRDAKGDHSVAHLRRPGWHRLEIARKSEQEVELRINGDVIGTYQARGLKPAREVEVGDSSTSEGAGEAYWGATVITCGQGPAAVQSAVRAWRVQATEGGRAEQGSEFQEVRRAQLYLRDVAGKEAARCQAEWGQVQVAVPYQFWCQVYVSEQPYQAFSVVCPLTREGKPTDIEVQFEDEPGAAGEKGPQQGFVWVVDREGRHGVGSVTRGVWHELILRRRTAQEVDLLIDGRPVHTFASRSTDPVASYRFGDFAAENQAGEAYWYRIGLVQVPKD